MGNSCRVCGGPLATFFDLGRQPLSDAFLLADRTDDEFFYHLQVGLCRECSMVQLLEEVPRERMFHDEYPYHSSGSATMRAHFEQLAKTLLDRELTGPDPFVVEIGCNDGIMLTTIAQAGVRHLGVDPSGGVAQVARDKGVQVATEFFEHDSAVRIRDRQGQADVVYAANTMCHIPYVDSVFAGLDALLTDDGVFVFEDPYLGEIVRRTSFDQIYDEHFYFFTARSVQAMARRFGFELVDVEHLPVHGGEVRYTLARRGARTPTDAVAALFAEEDRRGLGSLDTLTEFAQRVERIRDDLLALLSKLRADGQRVVGYGATAKSATVTNFCGIDRSLVECVYDTTPAKQGRLTPGAHLPVEPHAGFSDPYPPYALLFAWNHADEIIGKEQGFAAAGGKWIMYVPEVHVVDAAGGE